MVFANGLFIDVGVSLTAAKIVLIGFMPSMVMGRTPISLIGPDRGLVLLFLAYGLLVTAILGLTLPYVPTADFEGRVRWRWVIQAGSFGLSVLPYFLCLGLVRSERGVERILDMLVVGAALLAAIGLLQWILVTQFGIDAFGIAREGLTGREFYQASIYIEDYAFSRINSFAREPKDLGTALALMLPIVIWRTTGVARTLLLALMSSALVLTYSTTAFILLLLCLACFAPLLYSWRHTRKSLVRGLIVALLVILPSSLLIQGEQKALIEDVFDARVLQRLGVLEEYDELALDFLNAEPRWLVTGVGAGLTPFFANKYLPTDPVLLSYMDNLTWDPKAGLLRWVAAFGLLGVALALGSVVRVALELKRVAVISMHDRMATFLVTYLLYVTFAQLLRGVDEFFWFALGTSAAYVLQARRALSVAGPYK